MPIRNIHLTDDLDRFILNRIEKGRYHDASEVMQAALRILEREEKEFDVRMTRLRASIDEGDASGMADPGVFARMRDQLKPPAEGR